MKIEDLGYSPFFEKKRIELGLGDFSPARVTSESKEIYEVRNGKGRYLARVTGKQIFQASSRADYPAVGDWVAINEICRGRAVIRGILPRLSVIKRVHKDKSRTGGGNETQIIAANIDTAFIVESADRDYNLNRFERYFAVAQSGGVKPAVILNKIDLFSAEELREKVRQLQGRFPEADVILTSTVSNDGLAELKEHIAAGRTYCFLGSSGVGKSSLINKLLGEEAVRTGSVSSYSGRGKHITARRQMYFLKGGGIVVDNPGMREISVAGAGPGVDAYFGDIAELASKCKYADCTHAREPGCAVREAVRSGELDKAKYANFINLKKEAEYGEMSDTEKRGKDRQFGKFLKQAKKELRDLGRKS